MTARSLDLFSTSPTEGAFPDRGIVQSEALFCSYHAPYFAHQKEGKFYGVSQGCCNHWDCPRCGIQRAKQEYGRIVSGCQKLADTHKLYFITITCRGRSLSVNAAEQGYLTWTNRFLDACRIKAKRSEQDWYYVQVTEKQKRGHPHSHILTTFDPQDIYLGHVWKRDTWGGVSKNFRNLALRSDWLAKAVANAGLGEQYDVSIVHSSAAASRYVAKYMFKDSMFGSHWKKGWKRVRYSQSFPQLPDRETNAFVLLSRADWRKLASLASTIVTDSEMTKKQVLWELRGHDVLVG